MRRDQEVNGVIAENTLQGFARYRTSLLDVPYLSTRSLPSPRPSSTRCVHAKRHHPNPATRHPPSNKTLELIDLDTQPSQKHLVFYMLASS